MLNQVILVGRVEEIDRNEPRITLRIERPSKNGKDYDFIPLLLNENLTESTFEYIKEGITLGAKATLYVEDGFVTVIAEKLTFINTN